MSGSRPSLEAWGPRNWALQAITPATALTHHSHTHSGRRGKDSFPSCDLTIRGTPENSHPWLPWRQVEAVHLGSIMRGTAVSLPSKFRPPENEGTLTRCKVCGVEPVKSSQ